MRQRSPIDTEGKIPRAGQRSGDTGTPDLNGKPVRDATSCGRSRFSLSCDRCEARASSQGERPPHGFGVSASGGRIPALDPAGNRGAKKSAPVQGDRSEGLGGGERGREGSAWGKRCATSHRSARPRLSVKGLSPLNNPHFAEASGDNRSSAPCIRGRRNARPRPSRRT